MIDTSSLTDYTFAQIKLAAKAAMMSAALGGSSISIGGRVIGRITPDEARKLYDWATQMEADENTLSPGGTALVQYGERV